MNEQQFIRSLNSSRNSAIFPILIPKKPHWRVPKVESNLAAVTACNSVTATAGSGRRGCVLYDVLGRSGGGGWNSGALMTDDACNTFI
jgi:hypothetical protein